MDYSQRIRQEMQTGLPFEGRTRLFLEKWYEVREATSEEDMRGKVDLIATRGQDRYAVQVKKPSRSGNVFIEYMSVNGQEGWGLTCDLLAKWLDDRTLMMVRLGNVRKNWGDPGEFRTCYAGQAKGEWYRRPGRLDVCREFSVDWFRKHANAKVFTL